MATEHRTVIQVGLKGLPEARRALEGLRLELQERLMERYGSRLGVEVGDITDAAEVAELLEATETTEACASLHICLNRGWREGASLLIRWDSKEPARLVVSTSASSRLEAQTIAWVTGSPAAALAAYTFFFIDRRWISVALGAMVGILVGMGLYCVLARPILALAAVDMPYATYFEGAQFVHFLLGPATVALAVPLYFNRAKLRRLWLPLLGGLVVGSITAAVSAIGIAWLFGGSGETLLSLAPKSVTAPVAMGIAEKLGGLPSLTAILVVATGILGAVLGPMTLNLLRVRDQATRGFALGVTAHGIGTARAFQESEQAGAFSGLAMALNALATAVLLPVIVRLLGMA